MDKSSKRNLLLSIRDALIMVPTAVVVSYIIILFLNPIDPRTWESEHWGKMTLTTNITLLLICEGYNLHILGKKQRNKL